jgi:hypothetical protein
MTGLIGFIGYLFLYCNDIHFAERAPFTVAEGTDGTMIYFGGINYGGWLMQKDSVEIYYNAGATKIAFGESEISGRLYVKDSLFADSTFHWKVVAQNKLYLWGWHTTFKIEVGCSFQGLPTNIFGVPLAKATYDGGKMTKCEPLGI